MCEECERLKQEEERAILAVVRAHSMLDTFLPGGPLTGEVASDWERRGQAFDAAQDARMQARWRVAEHQRTHRAAIE
jgi:hypothetical protein